MKSPGSWRELAPRAYRKPMGKLLEAYRKPTLSGQSTFAVLLPRIIIGNIDSAMKITIHQGSLRRSIFDIGHVYLATYLVITLPRCCKVKDEINYIL